MPILDLFFHQLHYESRSAENPRGTLVFLHGSGGTSQIWQGQMEVLGNDWNCIAIDLPGHGRSSSTVCKSTTEATALVKAFLDRQSFLPPIYLVGHSLGAAIAMEYAYNYAEDLNGIIIIGGGAKLKVLPQILAGLSRNELDRNLVYMSFSSKTDPQLIASQTEIFMKNSPAVLYADFNACNGFDLTGALSGITLPALVIVGREDVLTPVRYAEYLKNHLAHGQLVIVESAGHFVMLEQPRLVNAAIKEFLDAFSG